MFLPPLFVIKRKQEGWQGKNFQPVIHSLSCPPDVFPGMRQQSFYEKIALSSHHDLFTSFQQHINLLLSSWKACCRQAAAQEHPQGPAAPGWPQSPTYSPGHSCSALSKGINHAPPTWPCFQMCCCYCYQLFSNNFLLIYYFSNRLHGSCLAIPECPWKPACNAKLNVKSHIRLSADKQTNKHLCAPILVLRLIFLYRFHCLNLQVPYEKPYPGIMALTLQQLFILFLLSSLWGHNSQGWETWISLIPLSFFVLWCIQYFCQM